MEKDQVIFLSNHIEQAAFTLYEAKKVDTTGKNFLPGFQKGKEAISGFEITRLDNNTSYLFTFINWQDENYYLVIYSPKKKAIAELKQIEVIDGDPFLVWKYNPLKRDGKNKDRKAYFEKAFGSTTRQIPFPKSASNTESFVNQLFTLCQNRQEADNIGEDVDF